MSKRTLVYTAADLRLRTIIIGEAAALGRHGIGAMILCTSARKGNVRYETAEKTPEGLRSRLIDKPGPTGFITTTTRRVEGELRSRDQALGHHHLFSR